MHGSRIASAARKRYCVSEEVADHLAHTYGGQARHVCALASPTGKRWPQTGILLAEGYPYRMVIRDVLICAHDA